MKSLADSKRTSRFDKGFCGILLSRCLPEQPFYDIKRSALRNLSLHNYIVQFSIVLSVGLKNNAQLCSISFETAPSLIIREQEHCPLEVRV